MSSHTDAVGELLTLLKTPNKWGGTWADGWRSICCDCDVNVSEDDAQHRAQCPIHEDWKKDARIKELIAQIDTTQQAPDAQPADEDAEADRTWRRLALQFDGHRMQAIGLLRLAAITLKGGNKAALALVNGDIEKFLAAPPLAGETVLAERIVALAEQPQAVVTWLRANTNEFGAAERIEARYKSDAPGAGS